MLLVYTNNGADMGLDTVELVMEIEDEFGFQMSDHDAELIQTCGQLCAYVLARVKPDPRGRTLCSTARAFYFLRRELMAQVPLPKRCLRPGTKLTDVLTGRIAAGGKPSRGTLGSKPCTHS